MDLDEKKFVIVCVANLNLAAIYYYFLDLTVSR